MNNSNTAIPEELKQLNQWVCHEDKVPYQTNGKYASVSDPGTWTTFQEASSCSQQSKTIDGIGFVFTESDPYIAIDLDDCIDENGVLVKGAIEIVERLNSYTEISVSGSGLHIILQGTLPEGMKKKIIDASEYGFKQIEIYNKGRYFTMTGDVYEDYKEIRTIEPSELDFFIDTQKTERKKYSRNNDYSDSTEHLSRVEYILEQVESKRLDLTHSYEQWIGIGMALNSEFGEAGEELFQRFSQFYVGNGDCTRELRSKKYRSFNSQSGGITIGSLYKIALDAGLKTFKPLNIRFVSSKSFKEQIEAISSSNDKDEFDMLFKYGDLNTKGYDVKEGLKKLASIAAKWANFDDTFIHYVISQSKIYDPVWDSEQDNGKHFGQSIVEEIFQSKGVFHDNEIEGWIKLYHKPRYNLVTGRVELSENGGYSPISDRNANSLVRVLKKKGAKVTRNKVDELLNSEYSTDYHPFKEYFGTLPEVKGDSSIRAYAKRVKVKDPDGASGVTLKGKQLTNAEWFQECLKRWLVATVAGAIDDESVNHTVLILSGAQGIGKTIYTRNLLPKVLEKYYYNGVINPDDKDMLIHLAECFLILWDEMCAKNRAESGKIKEIITKDKIRVRRPYGRYAETLNRHASIIGSVNDTELLTDTTGNRRFLIHEVEHIDYRTPENIDELWAEAYSYYKSGYKFWFDHDEISQLNVYNSKFEQQSEVEQRLLAKFVPGDNNPESQRLTATEIMDELYDGTSRQYSRYDVVSLGKILSKHNFTSKRSGNQKKYQVLTVQSSKRQQMFNTKLP